MEHAEKHKKSEKDLKSGHSAGKGKEGGKLEWQTNQKTVQLPAGNAFPLQNNGSSHPRLNSSAGKYSAAVVPGIQEHENRAQLSPEKGYLIENESE